MEYFVSFFLKKRDESDLFKIVSCLNEYFNECFVWFVKSINWHVWPKNYFILARNLVRIYLSGMNRWKKNLIRSSGLNGSYIKKKCTDTSFSHNIIITVLEFFRCPFIFYNEYKCQFWFWLGWVLEYVYYYPI